MSAGLRFVAVVVGAVVDVTGIGEAAVDEDENYEVPERMSHADRVRAGSDLFALPGASAVLCVRVG